LSLGVETKWTFLDTIRTSPALAKALVKLEMGLGEVSKAWDGSGEYDAPRPVCRKKRVLSQREVEALIEGYQNGRTVYELGAEFGIHRGTVSKLLKRVGVPMRRRGLDESQYREVAALRAKGMSFAKLGERFGVDASTVRRFLLQDC
jgi:DNA-binding CsgD family transcriptional regulator